MGTTTSRSPKDSPRVSPGAFFIAYHVKIVPANEDRTPFQRLQPVSDRCSTARSDCIPATSLSSPASCGNRTVLMGAGQTQEASGLFVHRPFETRLTHPPG